jgi:hypothetical protein
LLPRPGIHADLAALPALAAAHEDGAAGGIKVALCERKCFADPEAGAPKHDDQSAHPDAVGAITGAAHDRDDLLDGQWIGGVAQAFVAWRATVVIAG